MKKFLLLFAALLTLSVAANAQDRIQMFVDGAWLYAINPDADHEVTVIEYRGREYEDATELTIPTYATYGGSRYFVTALGEGLFTLSWNDDTSKYTHTWGHLTFTKLEKVTIPSTVTTIGSQAFYGCTALASITLPNSVTTIGGQAFSGCSALASITIPNSVTTIEGYTFSGCTALASVTLPNSLTTIGDQAFSGCRSLASVTLPNSLTTIGEYAFRRCTSLTTITIPSSVTSIDYSPFCSCTSLQGIVVEEGNNNYASKDGVLYNKNFTDLVSYPAGKEGSAFEIPGSVTYILNSAFSGCSGLTAITIPNSVTAIYHNAFEDCTALATITIPNSVGAIYSYTFQRCTSLTSVTIPASVTLIQHRAFLDCTSLETIYALPTIPPTAQDLAFSGVPETAVVYIPKDTFRAYFVADGWSYFTDFREMGALDITLSESSISIEEGNTATLTATVTKDSDVTVESESWTSSDPEVATVDNDGLVTAVGVGTATISYTVVDGYGCPHTESCDVKVAHMSGIDAITAEGADAPAEYFTLSGVRISAETLTPGLYIKRQGGKASKVLVK